MLKTNLIPLVISTICIATVLAPVPNLGYPSRRPQEEKRPAEELEVKISLLKHGITAGDTLELRVEIWNIGTDDLFICKDFQGPLVALCNLRLEFEPLSGGSRVLSAADAVPAQKKESLVNGLVRNWISLPPKHFYGAILQLDPSKYPELANAGHYRIQGSYTSGGLLTPANYNSVQAYPNEVERLPGKSWRGVVSTNVVEVRVTVNKK